MEVEPDKSHTNIDHLSKLNEELGFEAIIDSISYAHLFYIDMIPKKYAKNN